MKTKKKGRIFVISSPSGGGKTTVCNQLKKEGFNIQFSVSATTRLPRVGEQDGKDYYFLKKNAFKRLIRKNGFLEWAENFGNLYGTPKEFVLNAISKGNNIILPIDVKGAMQVKKIYKNAVLVFLLPPSMKLLKNRLKKRKTEEVRTLTHRLEVAKKELTYVNKYDYTIVNDRLDKAVETFKSIIAGERNKNRKKG